MHLEEAITEDFYNTVVKDGESLYKEKGSKFIGHSFHVESVEEAMAALEDLKNRYHDARHHCFAYRINPEKPEVRANDDGEPSNSAGMPIYNQIQSFELWNTLVVVVRYFGGTKLGVSGLISAYKEAAQGSLENAKIEKHYLMETISIRYPYDNTNDVMRLVKEENAELLEEKMGQDAGYLLGIRKGRYEAFLEKLGRIHQVQID